MMDKAIQKLITNLLIERFAKDGRSPDKIYSVI